jgi:sugar/nucleoside kinase (ribokinase family)
MDVVCVGNVMVDIIFTGLPRPPLIGEEIYGDRYTIDVGGGAAIVAVGLRSLGLKTALVAACGNDLFGRLIVETLQTYCVDLRSFSRDETSMTNLSMEMSFQTGRATATVLNSDSDSRLDDMIAELLVQSKHLHVLGLSDARIELLEFAIAQGLTTSVDTDLRRDTQRALIGRALPFIDFLLPNLAEVSGLSEAGDVQEAAMKLGERLRRYCVIKMGGEGALASNGRSVIKVNAFPAPVADTTGAGDAFNAGFIYGFLQGYSLKDCMVIGNAMGSLEVRKVGGVAAIPTLDQLQDFLIQHELKLAV